MIPIRIFSVLVALTFLVGSTSLTAALETSRMTAEDRADLGRIQMKINSFRTLSTRFRQISPHGRTSRGNIFIQRPGQLRVQFDHKQMLILTSRFWLIVIQGRQGEPQYFPLNSTPAGILVRSNVTFDRDIRVTRVQRNGDKIFVTIARREALRQGKMILIFERKTLNLTGWTIIDARGLPTRVLLSETRLNVQLKPSLFYVPQDLVRPGGTSSDR